jgi:hypothetical protein
MPVADIRVTGSGNWRVDGLKSGSAASPLRTVAPDAPVDRRGLHCGSLHQRDKRIRMSLNGVQTSVRLCSPLKGWQAILPG